MFWFLIPLLLGFALAGASAFTAEWSRRWGPRDGGLVSNLLRNLLGIPLYFLGLVLAWRTPAPELLASGAVGIGLAWLLITAGAIPVLLGHLQLGRPTHMPTVADTLMEQGMYAHVRHPIYAGGLLMFAGMAFLRPTLPWLLACSLCGVFLGVQSRLEEIDLVQRISGYREYMTRVPRFIPKVLQRWAWLCPLLGLAMAAAIFYLWGLSWWTAILAALMLACPVTLLWWLMVLRRNTDIAYRRGTNEKGKTS